MGSYQFYECLRCDREFRSQAAKEQHMRDSSRHNVCHLCGVRDYEYADDLDDHLKDDHHFCIKCDQIFYGDWLLEQHNVDVHNLCVTCGRRFTSPSNLNNVCRRVVDGKAGAVTHMDNSTRSSTRPRTSSAWDAIANLQPTRPWCCTSKLERAHLESTARSSMTSHPTVASTRTIAVMIQSTITNVLVARLPFGI
ncbi:hypothetical protein NW759_012758 [Fusarium solani]|nr:hypothetical protein NW759_012758 [Fusarium solani]